MQARMIPAIPSSWLIRDQNTQLPIQGARDHGVSRKILYETNQRFTCRSGLGRRSSDDARVCIRSRGRWWWRGRGRWSWRGGGPGGWGGGGGWWGGGGGELLWGRARRWGGGTAFGVICLLVSSRRSR